MKKITEQNKKLLLKDLCARLPYEVKIHIDFEEIGHIVGDATLDSIKTFTGQFDFVGFEQDFKNGDCLPISGLCGNKLLCIDEFKPYLRPMSTMTEKEKKELSNYENSVQRTDFFYSHHIDCRFMIEKGLALVAPEDMYETE